MSKGKVLLAGIVLLGLAVGLGLRYAARRATADSRFRGDARRRVFDPTRDAGKDLEQAKLQARAQGKHILMDVGGNWCPSCLVLDATLRDDAGLRTLLDRNYVLLHVNWSTENRNAAVLERYPEAHGYPALYVLGADGRLIRAENTAELEGTGGGYRRDAIAAFLVKYGVGS